MRIAIAADERTGIADALAAAPADRGHTVVNVVHVVAIEAGR
jgi:hypothetical protein